MSRPCCATAMLRPFGYELRCQSCGRRSVPAIDFAGRIYLPTEIKIEATRRLQGVR